MKHIKTYTQLLESNVTQMNLTDLNIEVTRRCNYKCGHCAKGKSQAKDLNPKILDSFFDMVSTARVINLSGGEPFLKMDIIYEIVKMIDKKPIDVSGISIVTNGDVREPDLKILKKIFDILIKNKIAIGIEISNDTFHKECRTKYFQERVNKLLSLHNYKGNKYIVVSLRDEKPEGAKRFPLVKAGRAKDLNYPEMRDPKIGDEKHYLYLKKFSLGYPTGDHYGKVKMGDDFYYNPPYEIHAPIIISVEGDVSLVYNVPYPKVKKHSFINIKSPKFNAKFLYYFIHNIRKKDIEKVYDSLCIKNI